MNEDETTLAWKLVGEFRAEGIYRHLDGSIALEKDHQWLVAPTPAEEEEIFRLYPDLKIT